MSVSNMFLRFLMKQADIMESNAGFSGYSHDGGAEKLRSQVRIYESAACGDIPNEWADLKLQFDREQDPKYQEYLRLKDLYD